MTNPLHLLRLCLADVRQHALTAGISVVLCIIAGAAVSLLLSRAAPNLSALGALSSFVSLGPLLVILLCLAPCLAPLLLLLKRGNRQTEAPETPEAKQAPGAPGSPDI